MMWAVGMFIESQSSMGWKKSQSSSSSNFPAVGRDLSLDQVDQSPI